MVMAATENRRLEQLADIKDSYISKMLEIEGKSYKEIEWEIGKVRWGNV